MKWQRSWTLNGQLCCPLLLHYIVLRSITARRPAPSTVLQHVVGMHLEPLPTQCLDEKLYRPLYLAAPLCCMSICHPFLYYP
jgi:hypothetical protein